jgi:GcrA cell cycle regulator
MSWTDERIDLLKRLWGDGHSASQIATQMGGVTRNAVIGKVHRLKLDSRLKAAAPAETAPVAAAIPKPPRPVLVETAPVAAAPAPVIVPVVEEVAPPRLVASTPTPTMTRPPVIRAVVGATALKIEPVVETVGAIDLDETRPSGEVVPISRNLTLVQLSERTCKWPLGDPLAADFRFCGNHSRDASPYCQYHARIAFQPVSERRRVR